MRPFAGMRRASEWSCQDVEGPGCGETEDGGDFLAAADRLKEL